MPLNLILADEVGLGKTIEAGLVINYVINAGARNIMIVLPATLRKQWEIELEEKFDLESSILDRLTVDKDRSAWKAWLENSNKTKIAIVSYDYSSKLMKTFPKVKWDFIVIDEAHNLRNVFHGTKRAKNLYEITKGIPKILLTATPLQNRLSDLHGLVSFIDDRIFGPEKIFNRKFVESGDYSELKEELSPILYRTLRKDVGKYMDFKKRTCITVDFKLSDAEAELYNQVNAFLKRKTLYSIPVNNRSLIILVIRKLLASSSFALVETFEVFKERLNKLYQGSKSANAQEGFDLFLEFLEDEIDESDFEDKEDENVIVELFDGVFGASDVALGALQSGTGFEQQVLEDADDSDIKFFTPTPKDEENYRKIYDKLLLEMSKKYEDSVQPIKDYNKEKIDNWFKIQIDQISLKMQDLQKEIENLLIEESMSSNRYEKEDILKKAAEKKKQLDKQQDGIGEKVKALKREADRTIEEFNAQYDINPVIFVNIVLKF